MENMIPRVEVRDMFDDSPFLVKRAFNTNTANNVGAIIGVADHARDRRRIRIIVPRWTHWALTLLASPKVLHGASY